MADNPGEASPVTTEQQPLVDRQQPPESCAEFSTSKKAIFFMTFVVWAVFGATLCATMRLGPVETLYVLSQIVTTVGYGDLVPESQAQKVAASFLMLASTLLVANVIMMAVDALLDAEAAKVSTAMEHKEAEITAMIARERRGLAEECNDDGEQARTGAKKMSLTRSTTLMHAGKTHAQVRRRAKLNRLASDALIFLSAVVCGTLFFGLVEACSCSYDDSHIDGCKEDRCKQTGGYVKTWIDAWYMSVTTITTVGFGDMTATTKWGRLFASIWMLLGTGAMVNFISSLSEAIYSYQTKRDNYKLMKKLFVEHDQDHDGLLDEREFLRLQFVQLGLVSAEQFDSILTQFKLIAGQDRKVSKAEYASYYMHEEARKKGSEGVFEDDPDEPPGWGGAAAAVSEGSVDEEAGVGSSDRAANDAADAAVAAG